MKINIILCFRERFSEKCIDEMKFIASYRTESTFYLNKDVFTRYVKWTLEDWEAVFPFAP